MTTSIDGQTDFDPALNMARQCLYRFAAISLLDPKFGSWNQLNLLRSDETLTQAAALIRELPESVPDELGLGERPVDGLDPQQVLDKLPESAVELNGQYEDTFGLLVTKACPPYETEYIGTKFTFQRSNALADVGGYYKAFGLTISDENPERHDHIVSELEFMSSLLGLQRQADADDLAVRPQRMDVCHDAQVSFLKEHLAWWTPPFARLLAREGEGTFYEAVSNFLSALIPVERALLGVEVPTHPLEPDTTEAPEECDGCDLVS